MMGLDRMRKILRDDLGVLHSSKWYSRRDAHPESPQRARVGGLAALLTPCSHFGACCARLPRATGEHALPSLANASRSLTASAPFSPTRPRGGLTRAVTVTGRATIPEPLLLGQLMVAGLAALGLRSQSSFGELLETRVGQGIVAAFEPPERVDDESREGGEDARRNAENRTK